MTRSNPHKLRPGFTTGAAAAAAAKGALIALLTGQPPESVDIRLLTDEWLNIPLFRCAVEADQAEASVIKDGGDDPDVTHKAEIGARVQVFPPDAGPRIRFLAGEGVGTVTKPGLEVLPGEPAINAGPRKMIAEAVAQALGNQKQSVAVTVFVPQGEALAQKTLNARLGILGGISILGTTGRVRPLSHAAYIATIRSGISVARAQGFDTVVMSTGRRSERYGQALFDGLPEEAFIQIGDFFRDSLQLAADAGMSEAVLTVFFGKAVKMAQGIPQTHAANSALTLERLAEQARALTGDADLCQRIQAANTARHIFESLRDDYPAVIHQLGAEMTRAGQGFAGQRMRVRGVLLDYEGGVLYDSGGGG